MLETIICRDNLSIYYPSAPGRVYVILLCDLADCDGSAEDFADSTLVKTVADLSYAEPSIVNFTPGRWPWHHGDDGFKDSDHERDADFADAVEMWLDWCDEDSARLDALDGAPSTAAAAAA